MPAGCGAQPWLQNTWGLRTARNVLFQPYSSPTLLPFTPCSNGAGVSSLALTHQVLHSFPPFLPVHDHGHQLGTSSDVLASSITSSSLHSLSFIRAYCSCSVKTERKKRAQSRIARCPLAIVPQGLATFLPLTVGFKII